MLLRLYSLVILILDLVTLLFGIFFAILIALYRIFRPPPLKNLYGEVAMVIKFYTLVYEELLGMKHLHFRLYFRLSELVEA